MNIKERPHLIPALIVTVMLFVAIAPLPYGYYQVLRWITFGCAIFVAVKGYFWRKMWATWTFSVIAVLFNPFLPVHLSKEIWMFIDIASGLVFGLSVALLKGVEGE